jgi:microsomal dipeptidase-like Zn-dependent dipeptidase
METGPVSGESSVPAAPRVTLGGDYWQADPGAELWGMADLHAHLMAHLAFGGTGFWGGVYDPELQGDEAMADVLASCAPVHGGLVNVNPEFGHPPGGGWPDFVVWPRFTTLSHQQAYIDWIYRAYQGGLRLITCLAVNNELLGTRSNPKLPTDDRSAVERQVNAMKAMAAWVNDQAGGPGKGWMQIAYSAAEARAIIAANKLAIVLGMEVDSFGNWRKLEDLQELSQGNLEKARELIASELDWLYALGIRQITPIHLTDNAFGGTAIYMRFLDAVNLFLTGRHYDVEDSWDTGIRYRLDVDADTLTNIERAAVVKGDGFSPTPRMSRRTLIQDLPGVKDIEEALYVPGKGRGHANARGLTVYGILLLQEMMARGLIIDTDHMSQKAMDTALEMAEAHNYPLIASHCWFRDLGFTSDVIFDRDGFAHYDTGDVHKVAHEAAKRADQVERLAKLGGMIAPILNQGDMPDIGRVLPELENKVPRPSAGSSTAWAQGYLYAVKHMGGRGVGIGSDINGAAGLPGPRFGSYAAYGIHTDPQRRHLRRGQIDSQVNGVRYTGPITDYRWHRFDEGGPGAYSKEEREIWQGIAQYLAGFNPAVEEHPADDKPLLHISTVDNAVHLLFRQDNIDNITQGFIAADEYPEDVRPDDWDDWPDEQQAAYLVKTGIKAEKRDDDDVEYWYSLIAPVWEKWQVMEGDNPPLVRSKAGPRRDFDINLDGMAHYGMLPDLLQDIRNQGLAVEDFAPLFRSAHDYVEVWARCEERGAILTSPTETGDMLASSQAA